jgi:polyferredoxin
MGIDIRNGPQLECIQCGLCIDACDSVMKKVGRPTALIAYDTDENVLRRWKGFPARNFSPFRPRIIVYALVFVFTAGLMAFGLSNRADVELSVLKDRALPFVQLASGDVRNGYTLKLVNKQREHRTFDVHVEGLPGAVIEIIGEGDSASPVVSAGPDGVERYRLLLTTAPGARKGASSDIRIVLTEAGKPVSAAAATFLEPEASNAS